MSKHTPGPWKAGRADMATLVNGVESKWIYAGDKYVAVASGLASDDWDEVMANARLIARAPEMADTIAALTARVEELEGVLDAVVQWADRHGKEPDWLEAARAAITKGESRD